MELKILILYLEFYVESYLCYCLYLCYFKTYFPIINTTLFKLLASTQITKLPL